MVHLTEHPHLCHTLPLELLITVKPPAPRERHDLSLSRFLSGMMRL